MTESELKDLERTGHIDSLKVVIAEFDLNGVHYEMPLCDLKEFLKKEGFNER